MPGGGKFQFRRVPFGLRAAPMWAQSQLREALDQNADTKGLVNFIDDISFGSDDPEELCTKFEALLKFAIAHNIKLKREKCCLGVPALKALGCVINSQGKWIDPDRVLATNQPSKNPEGAEATFRKYEFRETVDRARGHNMCTTHGPVEEKCKVPMGT